MKLVYCDESGDPGYPKYQTPIFLQSFLYLNTADWKDSYFVQLADLIAYLLSQYVYIKLNIDASPKRIRLIDNTQITDWVNRMSPIFNLEACPNSEFSYGIVVHPYK